MIGLERRGATVTVQVRGLDRMEVGRNACCFCWPKLTNMLCGQFQGCSMAKNPLGHYHAEQSLDEAGMPSLKVENMCIILKGAVTSPSMFGIG